MESVLSMGKQEVEKENITHDHGTPPKPPPPPLTTSSSSSLPHQQSPRFTIPTSTFTNTFSSGRFPSMSVSANSLLILSSSKTPTAASLSPSVLLSYDMFSLFQLGAGSSGRWTRTTTTTTTTTTDTTATPFVSKDGNGMNHLTKNDENDEDEELEEMVVMFPPQTQLETAESSTAATTTTTHLTSARVNTDPVPINAPQSHPIPTVTTPQELEPIIITDSNENDSQSIPFNEQLLHALDQYQKVQSGTVPATVQPSTSAAIVWIASTYLNHCQNDQNGHSQQPQCNNTTRNTGQSKTKIHPMISTNVVTTATMVPFDMMSTWMTAPFITDHRDAPTSSSHMVSTSTTTFESSSIPPSTSSNHVPDVNVENQFSITIKENEEMTIPMTKSTIQHSVVETTTHRSTVALCCHDTIPTVDFDPKSVITATTTTTTNMDIYHQYQMMIRNGMILESSLSSSPLPSPEWIIPILRHGSNTRIINDRCSLPKDPIFPATIVPQSCWSTDTTTTNRSMMIASCSDMMMISHRISTSIGSGWNGRPINISNDNDAYDGSRVFQATSTQRIIESLTAINVLETDDVVCPKIMDRSTTMMVKEELDTGMKKAMPNREMELQNVNTSLESIPNDAAATLCSVVHDLSRNINDYRHVSLYDHCPVRTMLVNESHVKHSWDIPLPNRTLLAISPASFQPPRLSNTPSFPAHWSKPPVSALTSTQEEAALIPYDVISYFAASCMTHNTQQYESNLCVDDNRGKCADKNKHSNTVQDIAAVFQSHQGVIQNKSKPESESIEINGIVLKDDEQILVESSNVVVVDTDDSNDWVMVDDITNTWNDPKRNDNQEIGISTVSELSTVEDAALEFNTAHDAAIITVVGITTASIMDSHVDILNDTAVDDIHNHSDTKGECHRDTNQRIGAEQIVPVGNKEAEESPMNTADPMLMYLDALNHFQTIGSQQSSPLQPTANHKLPSFMIPIRSNTVTLRTNDSTPHFPAQFTKSSCSSAMIPIDMISTSITAPFIVFLPPDMHPCPTSQESEKLDGDDDCKAVVLSTTEACNNKEETKPLSDRVDLPATVSDNNANSHYVDSITEEKMHESWQGNDTSNDHPIDSSCIDTNASQTASPEMVSKEVFPLEASNGFLFNDSAIICASVEDVISVDETIFVGDVDTTHHDNFGKEMVQKRSIQCTASDLDVFVDKTLSTVVDEANLEAFENVDEANLEAYENGDVFTVLESECEKGNLIEPASCGDDPLQNETSSTGIVIDQPTNTPGMHRDASALSTKLSGSNSEIPTVGENKDAPVFEDTDVVFLGNITEHQDVELSEFDRHENIVLKHLSPTLPCDIEGKMTDEHKTLGIDHKESRDIDAPTRQSTSLSASTSTEGIENVTLSACEVTDEHGFVDIEGKKSRDIDALTQQSTSLFASTSTEGIENVTLPACEVTDEHGLVDIEKKESRDIDALTHTNASMSASTSAEGIENVTLPTCTVTDEHGLVDIEKKESRDIDALASTSTKGIKNVVLPACEVTDEHGLVDIEEKRSREFDALTQQSTSLFASTSTEGIENVTLPACEVTDEQKESRDIDALTQQNTSMSASTSTEGNENVTTGTASTKENHHLQATEDQTLQKIIPAIITTVTSTTKTLDKAPKVSYAAIAKKNKSVLTTPLAATNQKPLITANSGTSTVSDKSTVAAKETPNNTITHPSNRSISLSTGSRFVPSLGGVVDTALSKKQNQDDTAVSRPVKTRSKSTSLADESYVLVLTSSTLKINGRVDVLKQQSKAISYMESNKIEYRMLDASDTLHQNECTGLYMLSRLSNVYPQFFHVDASGIPVFCGAMDQIENMIEDGSFLRIYGDSSKHTTGIVVPSADYRSCDPVFNVAKEVETKDDGNVHVVTYGNENSRGGESEPNVRNSMSDGVVNKTKSPSESNNRGTKKKSEKNSIKVDASVGTKESVKDKEQTKSEITIYGATSFVAKHAIDYFMQVSLSLRGDRTITLAGRSKSKLLALQSLLTEKMANLTMITHKPMGKCLFDTVVAESTDVAALKNMVQRTQLVVNFAGPYTKYGEHVVAACATCGTDYIDITGEISWAGEMRQRYSDIAENSGARIISLCGFDSIPSDLAIFAAVDALRRARRSNVEIESGTCWHSSAGMANGGTIHSALGIPLKLRYCFSQPTPFLLDDPLVLTHPRARFDPNNQEAKNRMAKVEWLNQLPSFDSILILGASAPFFMAPINAKVVHATAVALKYGPYFTYRERFLPLGVAPTRRMGLLSIIPALMVQLGLLVVAAILMTPYIGKFLADWLAPPGSGAPDYACKAGFAHVYSEVSTKPDARGLVDKANCSINFEGDPGNWVTAQCVCESALALILDKSKLPPRSKDGFGTPAELMGSVLLNRLQTTSVRPVKVKTHVRKDVPQHETVVFI
jgi:short subunit dehydrogenase-like uncharacterized protein